VTPADDSTGTPTHIGRYRVVARLGKGTMGIVYAAEDETLGRRVAVKVMMADLQDEPEVRERFYREARVTSQLTHRNIVTVFDFGQDRGHPYIVMELLTGLPLADYLRTPAAASIDRRIELMQQTCEGLQLAHARGVIHRDIKPSNLFVQRDGTLKILDFGVARLASSSLTLSGFLVGTPEYMAPEQAQGFTVDGRSDLFSAAAVFYLMLAGRGPFAVGDLPAVLRAVVVEPPPPLTDEEAPEPLRRVLMRALAKAPAERYQQCADLLADLTRVRRTLDATTRRMVLAAVERYRQTLDLIEKRRALGTALSTPGIGRACDEAVAQLAAWFPVCAAHIATGAPIDLADRHAANAMLEALQTRHNLEMAALAALQDDSVDTLRRGEPVPPEEKPGRSRSGSVWRRLVPPRGRS
jgi:serine/threonine-protein kinase